MTHGFRIRGTLAAHTAPRMLPLVPRHGVQLERTEKIKKREILTAQSVQENRERRIASPHREYSSYLPCARQEHRAEFECRRAARIGSHGTRPIACAPCRFRPSARRKNSIRLDSPPASLNVNSDART